MADPLDIFGSAADPLDLFGSAETITDPLSGREIPKSLVPRFEPPAEEEEFEKPDYRPAWLKKVGSSALSGAASVNALASEVSPYALTQRLLRGKEYPGTPASALARRAQSLDEAATERLAEASVDLPEDSASGYNPFASRARLGFWSAEVVGGLLDPLELLPGGMFARGATKAARGLSGFSDIAGRAVSEGVTEGVQEFTEKGARELGDSARGAIGEQQAQRAGRLVDDLKLGLEDIQARLAAGKITEAEAEARLLQLRRMEQRITDPHLEELAEKSQSLEGVVDESQMALDRLLGREPGTTDPLTGSLRPPETPFQYHAGSLDLPASARSDVKQVMESPETLARRRTGTKLHMEPAEVLRVELGMTEDDFLKAPYGTVWNAEEHALLKSYASKWGRRIEELRPQMAADLAAGKNNTKAINEFADARVKYLDLLGRDMAGESEIGRTLNSFKRLRTALDSPESLREYLVRKLACPGVLRAMGGG